MKLIMTAIMALSITATSMASDVSQTALDTLLGSSTTQVSGDILKDETVSSIYNNALEELAVVKNECVKSESSKDELKCTLMLTTSYGDTALIYNVNAAGTELQSVHVEVSRGH